MLALDSGEHFRVHTDLLELCSPKLASLLNSSGRGHVHLTDVSGKQALLLLHALYAGPGLSAWAQMQSPRDLADLARLSKVVSCSQLLETADKALVKYVVNDIKQPKPTWHSPWLRASTVVHEYMSAHKLGLPAYQKQCAAVMVDLCSRRQLPTYHLESNAVAESFQLSVLIPFLDELQQHFGRQTEMQ